MGAQHDAGRRGDDWSEKVITIKNLQHRFPLEDGLDRQALVDIDLVVRDGEFLAIVGPSGCGKTTLLNLVCGLEPLQEGELLVQGHAPRPGAADVGYMLARDCLLPWRKAIDNAQLALEVQGVPAAERRQRASDALKSVGLSRFENSYPAQLSHGMRQRVALARVFAAAPALILLDEPFSALDAQNRVLVQDSFLEVWERQRSTVLLITHDLAEAIVLADRVAVMSASPGRIKVIHEVNLPRPRSASELRATPAFHETYDAIWEDLKGEVTRAAEETFELAAAGSKA